MKHHKKDVMESGHDVGWETTICLEREKRRIPRKLLECCSIKANRNTCMNLSVGIGTSVRGSRRDGYGGESIVTSAITPVQPDRQWQ